MRRHGSPQQLEAIRVRAIELHDEGLEVVEIAEAVGRSTRSVKNWIAAFCKRGMAGIAAKKHPGATPKLTKQQRNGLQRRLMNGAVSNGFATEMWTAPRVRQLILDVYGVEYHVNYVPDLLRSLGFTRQKPTRRARERSEDGIVEWIHRDWPRIKKKHAVATPA